MQGCGGISTATYKSRAVGNLKVQYLQFWLPRLQDTEILHEQKLNSETVRADFVLELCTFLLKLSFWKPNKIPLSTIYFRVFK